MDCTDNTINMDNICQELDENKFQYEKNQHIIIIKINNKYIKWFHVYVFDSLYYLDVKFIYNNNESDKIKKFCASEYYNYYSHGNYTKRVYGYHEIIHDLKIINKNLIS